MENNKLLNDLKKQEEALQFHSFSIQNAQKIGLELMKKGNEKKLPIAIDITRNGHQLFHVALEGSTPDNDAWIQRKMNVVNRFSHSSYYMSVLLESKGTTIEKASLLNESEYAPHGGSFPIIIKNTGVIGTITVSGLASADDHNLVVTVLETFLGKPLTNL